MKLLIHSGGYLLSPWRANELTEIRTARGEVHDCHWSPSTTDFLAAGRTSGGSSPAADVAAMIQVIGNQGAESIEELRIIGHANSKVFSLAGSIRCDDVYFVNEPAIIGDSPTFKAAIPKCRDVQDRLTKDAKVILLGCNGGSGTQDLLDLVGHALLRPVAGFKEEIQYRFDYGPTQMPGNRLILQGHNRTRVTTRGLMKYESFGNLFGSWQTNAWTLKPDASSNNSDVYIGTRDGDRARGCATLFWMILREFYSKPWASEDYPWVSGTAADASVAGLRVRYYAAAQAVRQAGTVVQQAAGAHVDINPDFAAKTTPRTLKNRVTEIGKALELVKQKKSGLVPVTW